MDATALVQYPAIPADRPPLGADLGSQPQMPALCSVLTRPWPQEQFCKYNKALDGAVCPDRRQHCWAPFGQSQEGRPHAPAPGWLLVFGQPTCASSACQMFSLDFINVLQAEIHRCLF